MIIERLTVKNGVTDKIIRDIPFKKGVNLIYNVSLTGDNSGNSVGKTSVLRAIDYCLGAKSSSFFYEDKEKSKTDKNEVKLFLEENNLIFTLTLKKVNQNKIIITRSISSYYRINNIEYKSYTKFQQALNKELFYLNGKKPSVRQLLSKFLRYKEESADKTYSFLHQNTTAVDYENVFLVLFDSKVTEELLQKKSSLLSELKKTKDRYKLYEERGSLKTQEELVRQLKKEIEKLDLDKKQFNYSHIHKELSDDLNKLNFTISEYDKNIASLDYQLETLIQNKERLNESSHFVSVDLLKSLYSQAKSVLPELNKKYEDLVGFHEKMIEDRLKLVERGIEQKKEKIKPLEKSREKILEDRKQLLVTIDNKGGFEDRDKLTENLNTKYRELGKREDSILSLEKLQEKISKLQEGKDQVSNSIQEVYERMNDNISTFNDYFSEISRKLFNDNYVFTSSHDSKKDHLTFSIANGNLNAGQGRKKSEVMCFDWAYIKFLEHIGLDFPEFILYDGIEDIYWKQLKDICNELNDTSGQFIWALLEEKIRPLGKDFIDTHTTLTLSENDKFFKIESQEKSI